VTPAAVTQVALAVLLGGALGAGISLILWATPRWRAVSLGRRIAPYLRDVADPRGLTPLHAPVRDAGEKLVRRLGARVGGAADLEVRLRRAGWAMDAAAFRARQLTWAVVGLVTGAVFVVGLVLAGSFAPAVGVLPLLGAAGGAIGYDLRLGAAVRARSARAAEELPTILEFLALCLAAGESAFDAIRRVSSVGSGEIVTELRRAVLDVGTGSSLSDALASVGRAIDTPAVARSIDQIVAAIDRGAPLAQVLQAQAADAREDAKRVLIEKAGRKEIYMLLPLVFLILPLSVLIAVFPGIVLLRLGLS